MSQTRGTGDRTPARPRGSFPEHLLCKTLTALSHNFSQGCSILSLLEVKEWPQVRKGARGRRDSQLPLAPPGCSRGLHVKPCEMGRTPNVCTEFKLQCKRLRVFGGCVWQINALLTRACEQTRRQMGRPPGTWRAWPTSPQSAGGCPCWRSQTESTACGRRTTRGGFLSPLCLRGDNHRLLCSDAST